MAIEGESLLKDVFVPLVLQFLISAVTLGLSSAGSVVRYASIPVTSYFVYCVWSAASTHFRKQWASGIFFASANMLLHYVDVALFSRWTYHQNPYSQAAARSDTKGFSKDHAPALNSSSPSGVLSRIQWGCWALIQNRRLNTKEEPRSVLPLPNAAASSKLGYMTYASAKLLMLYMVCDVLAYNPPCIANIPMDLFEPQKVTVFGRLMAGEIITMSEIRTRATLVLHAWLFSYAMLNLAMVNAGLFAVSLGLSHPNAWKPLFSSISEAYTLRGFWGRSWHQALRSLLSKPAEWVVEDVLGLKVHVIPAGQKGRRWLARYAKIMLTFAFSGLLHAFVDSAGECGLFASGTMRFFLVQGVGIVVEDHAQLWFKAATGLGGGSQPTWWSRTLGYTWVAAFQLWAQPGFVYCHALAMASEAESPLAVSLTRRLLG